MARSRCRINRATLVVLTSLLAALASARADAVDGETIIECSNFTSAVHLCDALGGCDRDDKLQRRYFDAAMTCIMNWLDCDLYERTGSPKFDDCPARAIERCQDVYSDMAYFLSDKALFQRSQLVDHCEDLDFATEFLGGAPAGLDYDDDQGTCISLGTPLESLDDWITCGDKYQTRLYAELFSRAGTRKGGVRTCLSSLASGIIRRDRSVLRRCLRTVGALASTCRSTSATETFLCESVEVDSQGGPS
jgi:hypothetical protein